jgi:hypothetical protein
MRTTASVGGHPVHMMVVHFPMAFLMGSAAFDVAAAVGLAVPAVVAGYLLVAGLATGILAAAPGAVDFVTTVRPAGGRSASKAICQYGRHWKDVPGQHERQRVSVSFGKVSWTVAERKLREHIIATGVDSVQTFNEVTGPLTTFREQAIWWLREIRAGHILSKKRRTPMRSATIA